MKPHFIDFRAIVPHLGSRDEAFEEFCCQNAHHIASVPAESEFIRYRGAGGDGGVECVWRLPNGKEWGWQVKYIFDFSRALTKLTESIETAVRIHPQLEKYTVCLPFDLTGPTGKTKRSGEPALSEMERFDEWRTRQVEKALESGTDLIIHLETPSTLLDSLQSFDFDGGRLKFWFDATAFGTEWFERHLEEVRELAGPRYTPLLNIEVPVARALEGLGVTELWFNEITKQRKVLRKIDKDWEKAVSNDSEGGWDTPFPSGLRPEGESIAVSFGALMRILDIVVVERRVPIPQETAALVTKDLLPSFREIRIKLAALIDQEHGEGSSSSAHFRQFQAEYQVSFPTANLDRADEAIKSLESLSQLLGSASTCVVGKEEAVLIGEAGNGKTHVICDSATSRHERGLRTIVLFGERFSGSHEPWTQIRQQLGLADDISRDALLAALDAAGETSGYPLLLCIDGLNETSPRSYWRFHLSGIVAVARRYPYIKLCVSCRSTYLTQVLPEAGREWHVLEHQGFKGMEFDACRAFFAFYGLEAPMIPILQAEFSNPLFLRLICSAAQEKGHRRLPTGWQGIFAAVTALLQSKNERFTTQFGTSERHKIPEKGLQLFISAARGGTRAALPFDEATQILQAAVPQGVSCGLLIDWLLGESMLIADAEPDEATGELADYVRISFDRLGDHLLASKHLDDLTQPTVATAFAAGPLSFCVQSEDALQQNKGLLEALSIQIPERFGIELPDCIDTLEDVAKAIIKTTIGSLLWRDPSCLSKQTAQIMWRALAMPGMGKYACDALIEVASQPSPIDARFLDNFLCSVPMAERDAFWCRYLFQSFDDEGAVKKLIRAGLEMDVDNAEMSTIEGWAIALVWFCAAADRRVRDYSTKSLVRITERCPEIWEKLIERFSDCDDEYVVERCLLCAYGTLLRNRSAGATKVVAQAAFNMVFKNVERFQNAAIRDHARLILELAAADGALPDGITDSDYLPPYKSDWPLIIPSKASLKPWVDDHDHYPRLYSSCTTEDFFVYGMHRVSHYEHAVQKDGMGRWIFKHVIDMGYGGRRLAAYDWYMMETHGGGRGKPAWAERIGKKYQWIALARLAAKLGDHVQPKVDEWEPDVQGTPLTYLGGRDIDPGLLIKKRSLPPEVTAWWQPIAYDYSKAEEDNDGWINDKKDIPDSALLIEVKDPDGCPWVVLESYPHWKQARDEDESTYDGRKDMWMHIRSYMIAEEDFEGCWKWLPKQNFMGRWMPEGRDFHEGFIGEYPWATPFTLYAETWSERGGSGSAQLPCEMRPTCHSLNSHDEYDAYQTDSLNVQVPPRIFFEDGPLYWDGAGGFNDESGRKIFTDPSFGTDQPSALLVRPDFLNEFLRKRNLKIVWAILSEKLVFGDNSRPRLQYSRAHALENGKLVSSRPLVKIK